MEVASTHRDADGKASSALTGRVSGAGDPPKKSVSRGYPTRELLMISKTIAGTLESNGGVTRVQKIWKEGGYSPTGHVNVLPLYETTIKSV